MATTTTANYSGHDYTAELERLIALLPDSYTDRNHSDAGISITRNQASTSDGVYAFGDHVADEGFLPYAQFRQSLIDLGLLVGYLPTLASAASTRLQLTRVDPAGTDTIAIPQYTVFGRVDGIEYVTIEAVSIPAGTLAVEVNAIQGTVVSLEVSSDDFQVQDWTKHPRYSLGESVAAGTLAMWHGDSPLYWLEIDSWWRSDTTDLHFLLELNGDDDTVWIVAGDGTKGVALPENETISIRFVRTDEADGNCGTGVITTVPEAFEDLITCTNIEVATGGAAAEDVESMRRNIPRMVRTQRRGVIKEDYETLIEHLPGVLHCQCLDRNDSTYWPHEYVILYVVPDGGGPMTTLLKEQIWAECGSWGMYGSWKNRYLLFDATEVAVNIVARIGVLSGYSPDTVIGAVIAALTAVLDVQNRTIGGTLQFADLHAAASAVAGVSWVEFDAPEEDTTSGNGEVVVAGTISVTAQ
jgi:uncharacterized phage protein gp47/JayE